MPKVISNPDPESPAPWFDFDIDAGSMDVGISRAKGSMPLDHLPDNSRHPIEVSASKPDELHELVVELDGTLTFGPVSETPSVPYAHLAWYRPSSDEWTVVEFVEGK